MKNKQSQHNIIFSRIISMLIAVGLLVSSVAPYSASAITLPPQPTQMIPLENIVKIPKITAGDKVISDISRIDWGQQVSVGGKSVALNSDEALNAIAIPDDIKELIKIYRGDKSAIDQTIFMWPSTKTELKKNLDEGLKFSIAKNLVDKGELPKDYLELDAQGFIESADTIINVESAETLDPAKLIGVDPTVKIIRIENVEPEKKVRETPVSLIEKIENIAKGVIEHFAEWIHPESAYADVATVSQKATSYLAGKQNADGSWGSATSTKFITTAAVLEAFQANGITGTTTDKGIAWISTYFADNNDYMAQKLKILFRAGEATSTADILVYDQDTTLGGYPYDEEYKIDPLTTARVMQALYTANYKDPGEFPTHTQSLGLKYLIATKRFDNGWSVFPGGVSTIPVTSEVIETLLLWKHKTLGATKVDDTLDPAVLSMTEAQKPNGTWNNDLFNTALAYHAIKASGAIPKYQLETIDYLEDHQQGNGSFANDIYTTAKVLSALSISTDSGKLEITDIIPTSTLQTGLPLEYKIVVKNIGNTVVDSGRLHIITDGYHSNSFDFKDSGIAVNADSTINIVVGISNTRNYLGPVVFKVFVEGTNSVIHPSSRYEETLTFEADPANRPALPMYFVVYKNVSSTGEPAISWRWPVKTDPNLKNVFLRVRKLGDTKWEDFNVASITQSIATLQGFQQDEIYEATLGTVALDGLRYYYLVPVQVKVSASPSAYIAGSVSGKVKSLDGTIAGVNVTGVTASTTAISGEDGGYTQNNVPWGTGYARVSNFRYENYVEKYETANTTLTGKDVYTNLKSDTQIPTVTDVFIVGEADKGIENSGIKRIQYTVNDDIGQNGNGIVQSASISYFDPRDAKWHPIGVDSGLISGTRTHEWKISRYLRGQGYKIRVLAKDFAGKESVATEWGGTFKIRDVINSECRAYKGQPCN